jgi:serine/threonine protein kinase
LAAALVHTHRYKVVHRDVKPDNILLACRVPNRSSLTPASVVSSRVTLCDFGEAVNFNLEVYPRHDFCVPFPVPGYQLGGATAYLAPEITEAIPGAGVQLDYSCNAYALGMCIWRMMSAHRTSSVWPPSLPGYSEQLRSIAGGLLMDDPTKRLTLTSALESLWLLPSSVEIKEIRSLGGGAFGEVKLIEWDGVRVAAKFLSSTIAPTPENIRQLQTEAKLLIKW